MNETTGTIAEKKDNPDPTYNIGVQDVNIDYVAQ